METNLSSEWVLMELTPLTYFRAFHEPSNSKDPLAFGPSPT